MKKVLLIDDEPEIRDIIRCAIESSFTVEVIEASTGNHGIKLIQQHPDLAAIISDYRMPDGNGEEVAKYLKNLGSKIPFILCTGNFVSDLKYFSDNPPYGVIPKPNILRPTIELLKPILTAETSNTAGTDQQDNPFFPIRLKTILKFGITTADLYIKINDQKYVKVTQSGDTIEAPDVEKFSDRAVEALYLKGSPLPLLERLSNDLMKLQAIKELPPLTAFTISTEILEFVSDLNQSMGIPVEAQKLVMDSIRLTVASIGKTPQLQDFLKELLLDPNSYRASHSVLGANIACGLATLMGWNSDVTFFKLTMAAFLHDISLKSEELEKMRFILNAENNPQSYDLEKIEAYRSHPDQSADLLATFPDVSADVIQIIRQHHERPDGSGFPHGLMHTKIAPLTALLILSEELVHYRERIGMKPNFSDFIQELGPSFQKEPFRKILQALLKCA